MLIVWGPFKSLMGNEGITSLGYSRKKKKKRGGAEEEDMEFRGVLKK